MKTRWALVGLGLACCLVLGAYGTWIVLDSAAEAAKRARADAAQAQAEAAAAAMQQEVGRALYEAGAGIQQLADDLRAQSADRAARDRAEADRMVREADARFEVALEGLRSTTERVRADRSPYRVRRVIDGDTLEIVDNGGIRTRVRLRRIDAPEMDEPGGAEAKAGLEARLLGKRVKVTPYARDRYGRLIADVEPAM